MKYNYLFHLLVWSLPFLALQWFIGPKIFIRNWRAILFPTLIGGTYYTLADLFAVNSGLWFFDEKQIVGLYIGPLPIEEVLFFYITSWLVAQSMVLLLPDKLRA